MSDLAINVANISKAYRIGLKEKRHDTLGAAIAAWVKSPFRNFKRLKSLSNFNNPDDADIFWALKGINFKVKKGEVLGIIGKNGAGKSTLLKILSRITEPTDGRIEMYGRVASLLEVGTGFNPELTGRENIYLNGTILGMTKKEIDERIDEIIDFSGIEKFINTPVKRYSSGMKVRLAFAVAAHLEPEILLIDEVLAVGDVSFQKKCLGKMRDVSNSGRTVFFVSHDMGAIQSLCSRCILIKNGEVVFDGDTQVAVSKYLATFQQLGDNILNRKERGGNGDIRYTALQVIDDEGNVMDTVHSGQKVSIVLHYKDMTNGELSSRNLYYSIHTTSESGAKLFVLSTRHSSDIPQDISSSGSISCTILRVPLLPGQYWLTLTCKDNDILLDYVENAFELTVVSGLFKGYSRLHNNNAGPFLLEHNWTNSSNVRLPKNRNIEGSLASGESKGE